MTKTTHYPKHFIWIFFICVVLCALLLYVVHLFYNQITSENLQKNFVEIVSTVAENVELPSAITPVATETTPEPAKTEYIEITGGCGIHFGGTQCLNVRSGPGTNFPTVTQLRNGIVFKVGKLIENEEGKWYEIVFDEWLRYPTRVSKSWYVSAEHVRVFTDQGAQELDTSNLPPETTKKIVIDRSAQTLIAYDGDEIFLETAISTGLDLSPTPRGNFTIFRKTPTRYMQGPIPNIPGSDYYDLPGVPWNLYFTQEGAVIHGTYWHDSFGSQYSHGCVNVLPATAEKLYHWADLGTTVVVRD